VKNRQLWVVAVVFAAALVAWYLLGRKRGPVDVPPPPPEPPVEAPKNLVAEAVVATPDAIWHKAQTAVGGFLVLAPPTLGGVLAAYVGEPELAASVDGSLPAYAALGEGDWVIAAHVASASRARELLLGAEASAPRFAPEAKAGALEILRPESPSGAWIGLSRAFILVAPDRRSLEELGPYAYRTLPTKPPSSAAISASATQAGLGGWLHASLEQRWGSLRKYLLDKDDEDRKAHGGRAPDFADPKGLVAALQTVVDRHLGALGAMQSAEAILDIDDAAITLRVDLTPLEGDNAAAHWLDAFHGGSTAPLAAQDADALFTLFWRTSAPERAATAKDASGTLGETLGDRVPASQRDDLAALLLGAAEQRGDWASVSFRGGAATGVIVRLAAPDPKKLLPVVDKTFDLARKPGLGGWLHDALGVKSLTIDPHDFPSLGPGRRAHAAREGLQLDVGWLARGDEVDIGGGLDCDALLASLAPARRYGDDPVVASALNALGPEVAWALVGRPLSQGASPRSDAEVLGLAKDQGKARLTFRTTGLLVRQLLASLDLP